MIRKGQACILFSEQPPGTHFRAGSYSWVSTTTAREYIDAGYGKMYNPYEKSDLPMDTPGRKALLKNGVDSLERVSALDKERLMELDGIGEKTATEIIEWLETR